MTGGRGEGATPGPSNPGGSGNKVGWCPGPCPQVFRLPEDCRSSPLDAPSPPGLPNPSVSGEQEGPEKPTAKVGGRKGYQASFLSSVATPLAGLGSRGCTCWVWEGENRRLGWSWFLPSWWFQFTDGTSQTDLLMAGPEELVEGPDQRWSTGKGTAVLGV